jgi:hypothetical protein
VPDDQLGLLDLIDETQAHGRKQWLFFWRNSEDIEREVEASLFRHDESRFVADVTIPDGTTVEVDEYFEKVWELENIGFLSWHDRWLREENPGNGLLPEAPVVAVPGTAPGEKVRIAVRFRAPKYPSSCQSYWKMVDASGAYCYPWMKGVWCFVKVVY